MYSLIVTSLWAMWHPATTGQKKCSLISNYFFSPSCTALTVLIVVDVVYRKKQARGELCIGDEGCWCSTLYKVTFFISSQHRGEEGGIWVKLPSCAQIVLFGVSQSTRSFHHWISFPNCWHSKKGRRTRGPGPRPSQRVRLRPEHTAAQKSSGEPRWTLAMPQIKHHN